LDSKVLLGIIVVTIFGSFAVSGLFVQAGLEDLEISIELGNVAFSGIPSTVLTSTATCPNTHKVIGGGIAQLIFPGSGTTTTTETIDLGSNSYVVTYVFNSDSATLQAFASCAKINFPMMGMVGGLLLDIDTTGLLVASIGTNPVITGLFAVTVAGVVGQAVWFIHRRKKSENS